MKKIMLLAAICMLIMPVYAIEDTQQLSKEEAKYQLKLEKIKRKQALDQAKHPEKYNAPVQQQNFTLGLVQSKIKVGISQEEVVSALGSPNIITKDANGKDTWIYDKVASISSVASSSTGAGVGGLGGGYGGHGAGGGIINISHNRSNSNVQSNQKTLTVVIKFSNKNTVESFTYHMSNF
ncbi:MAG: hypothetical protein LUB59_04760 [Candidatus Gastranaerophilales bacterium]|nr:hypothetical protein [Candidatus Gastranaerophilales bacterium]